MTLAFALAFVTSLALALRAVTLRVDRRVRRRLDEGIERPDGRRRSLLAWLGRRVVPDAVRVQVGSRSGLTGRSLDRLVGAKVALAGMGTALGLLVAGSTAQRLLLGSALAAGGYTFPSFRLGRGRARVRRAVRSTIPDALDVIAVAVSAGLTPRLAIERAASSVPEPLASELQAVPRDVSLGVPWLAAISGVASRTGLEELRRLATTLARSERLGSPVAERLRTLARDVRAERRAEAEERARRAPVAMLFPLVFLILPAFVLTAVVPAVLVATRGIR